MAIELYRSGRTVHDVPSPPRLEPGLEARLARILGEEPFGGRARLAALHARLDHLSYGVVVCVPARDEAERLVATLNSVAASLDAVSEAAAIVVAVNNSTDATFGLARRWGEQHGRAMLVCDVRFADAIADAGHARRLALDAGALLAEPGAVLLSTDADTRVEPSWAPRMTGAVRAGADLVVGRIDTDEVEFAALPQAVQEAEAAERQLLARQDAMWSRLVPDALQAMGLRAGGANLAVSNDAYARIGGAPTPAFGEDRALVAAMLRHDRPVAVERSRTIRTSCRLEARASYGLSGMLKSRLGEPDPLCDEVLLPAHVFALRALAWRHLREARRTWRVREMIAGVEALGAALSVPPVSLFPTARTHGRDWERLLARLEPPSRLRVSDVPGEVRWADAILERTTPGAPVERLVKEILSC